MVASSIRFAGLERLNIFSLQALWAFGDLELDLLTFFERPEAFTGDHPFVVDSNGADEMGIVAGG